MESPILQTLCLSEDWLLQHPPTVNKLTGHLLRLSSRLRVIALNHPIDSVSMTVGLMSCTLSSFLLPKAPLKAN